jgi:hypothetical protein
LPAEVGHQVKGVRAPSKMWSSADAVAAINAWWDRALTSCATT